MSANVLVFTPTYQIGGVDQVRKRTLESIDNLQGSFKFLLGRFNPFNAGHENTLNQFKTAREIALSRDYDYMLTVEHDMIIPSNALLLLLALQVPVAYGVYVLRHGAKVLNTWRRTTGSYVGMSLSLFPEELKKAKREVTPEVSGVGFGCTLFSRSVLERFPFHGPKNGSGSIPDVPFAEDCIQNGIKQYAHFGVQCGHIEPSGRVLWPDKGENQMDMVKVVVLQDFNGAVGSVTVKFKAGDKLEIPEDPAKEFERAGYLSLEDKGKVSRKSSTKSVKPKAAKKVTKPLTTKSLKEGEEGSGDNK
jgi:hypothetical protein